MGTISTTTKLTRARQVSAVEVVPDLLGLRALDAAAGAFDGGRAAQRIRDEAAALARVRLRAAGSAAFAPGAPGTPG